MCRLLLQLRGGEKKKEKKEKKKRRRRRRRRREESSESKFRSHYTYSEESVFDDSII